MPYCVECGINYEKDSVCSQCGSRLITEQTPETIESKPDFGQPPDEKDVLIDSPIGPSLKLGHHSETHLGKGLIKPNVVEQDMDGFHFKYDRPPSNFSKAELHNDKVVEYRLTCPETESEETNRINVNTPAEDSKVVLAQEMPELTPELDLDMVETETPENEIMDQVELSLDNNEWVAGEIPGDTIAGIDLEEEPSEVSILPEPEIEVANDGNEVELLWEENEKWLGISLAKQYRITNRSIQVIDRAIRRFSEVDICLISDVKIQQSWFGKMMKTGNLVITVSNLPGTQLVLSGIQHPEKVMHLLEELIHPGL